MKTKYLISFIVVSLALIGSLAWAQNVQYPVAELGNCQDESACKSYCDKPENTEACVAFAEKNNLMSKEEVELAKKFVAAGSKGPGGCKGKDECEAFCNNMDHMDECISFAEKNNLIPPEELAEAKKVQAAIKRGVKPPPCGNKKQCDVYCEESEHMEECIAFGIEAGFIQGKELEDVQKMLAAVKRGVKPPPCKGKEACDAYCSSPDNMEVCMTFAIEAGFMNESEKADSQKMLQALKKGAKPPSCKGKEACDVYCAEDAHVEECINFAIAAGFMDAKDAEMAKKTKGKGPGGCKGKDECEAFCNNPDNQETCFNFGKENGLIPEEDLRRMEEGKRGNRGESNQKFQPGPGMENPGEQMMPQQAGPGGCKGPEECQAYCMSHPDECRGPSDNNQQFQENREGMMPSQGEGMMRPPEGGQFQQPPEGGQFQQPQNFQPSTGSTMPPPSGGPAPMPAPAPQTLLKYSPFGAIFNFFLGQ